MILREKLKLDTLSIAEIDYNTAHNVNYAARNFAMDYDIKPSGDFAFAKFILEEDDDQVPFIEMETGSFGKPFLIEHTPRAFAHILAKLKKIREREITFILR